MKIAIVTQYYPPEPVPIPHALAHGLAERGHDVRVVTAFPSYPNGRIYPGYHQRWRSLEEDRGVKVHRVPLFVSHSRSALGRLLSYGSFGWTSIFAAGFIKDVDVTYVYATQMTAAIAPSWWFRLFRIPFVLHVQDLWPESVTGSSLAGGKTLSRIINSVLTPWLAGMYRRAVGTIAIGPTMMRLLGERGVVEERLHAVFNWADDAGGLRDAKGKMSESQSLRVMYAGNMGELQDLQTVLQAAALVSDLRGFQLDLVGSGISEASLRDLAAKLKLDNVVFHGRVPVADMGEQYSRSDFQLVPLKDLQIFRGTIPSKFQASLASGIPVITNVAGDVSDIVLERNVGLTSTPGDPESLAMAFRTAYAMSGSARRAMGERGAKLYNEGMSMSRGIDKIEAILADAVRSSRRERVNDVQL